MFPSLVIALTLSSLLGERGFPPERVMLGLAACCVDEKRDIDALGTMAIEFLAEVPALPADICDDEREIAPGILIDLMIENYDSAFRTAKAMASVRVEVEATGEPEVVRIMGTARAGLQPIKLFEDCANDPEAIEAAKTRVHVALLAFTQGYQSERGKLTEGKII